MMVYGYWSCFGNLNIWMDGWTDRRIDKQKNGPTDEQTDGWMDGQMDGQTEVWMDEQIEV